MTDDFVARADALVAGAQEVIAASRRPEGLLPDRTPDAVSVDAAPDGSPRVSVAQGWEQQLPAAELGDAVTQAIAGFLASRGQGGPPEDLPPWVPDVSGTHLTTAMERINEALDAAGRRLQHATGLTPTMPQPTAENRTGQVKVYGSGDSVAVTVDPAWARGKTGATVTTELDELLHEAAATNPTPPAEDPLAVDPRAAYDYLRSML